MSNTNIPPAAVPLSGPGIGKIPTTDREAPTTPFAPVRVGIALIIGGALWVGPFYANNGVLLPARLAQIAPQEKVALVALLAITGSIVALLANVIFGALSDITRSRFGRRAPWMVVGSIGACASLFALSNANTVTGIVVIWCVFQLFLNAIAAPLLAVLADRVPPGRRGLYSALYGLGVLFGAGGSQVIATGYITHPATGMVVFAVAILFGGPLVAVILREKSNRDVPREPFSPAMILATFTFPRRGARDFYYALSGKLIFVVGLYGITGYQLYILTDYMHQSLADAGKTIALMSILLLVTSLIFGFISGPISDKLGRRKILVIGSAGLIAVAVLIPFLFPHPWAMLVYALVSGIGSGVYASIDQALNTEVLPSPANAAKDLGILNMANTGGQIIGPGLTSAIVAVTASYGPVFLVAAGLLVVSAVLIRPIKSVR